MSTRVANEVSRRQFLISSGVAVAAACLAPPRLFAQKGLVEIALKESATAKVTVQALRRNIRVLLGPGGNIAVLTGPDGKLLVDAEVVSARPNVTSALASINADPIKQLINTHWHFDHTGGNEWVHQAGASILAHENTRKRLSVDTRVEGWVYTFPAAPAGAIPTTFFRTSTRFTPTARPSPSSTTPQLIPIRTSQYTLPRLMFCTPETRSGIANIPLSTTRPEAALMVRFAQRKRTLRGRPQPRL